MASPSCGIHSNAVSLFEGLNTAFEIAEHGTKALRARVCARDGAQKFSEACGTGLAGGLADEYAVDLRRAARVPAAEVTKDVLLKISHRNAIDPGTAGAVRAENNVTLRKPGPPAEQL